MAVCHNPLKPSPSVRSLLGASSIGVGFCLGLMLGFLSPAGNASTRSLFPIEHHASLLVNPETQVKQTKNSDPLGEIINRRPNWRTDFELSTWLPRWLPQETVAMWTSMSHNETHMNLFYNNTPPSTDKEVKQRDAYFWTQMARLTATWANPSDQGKKNTPFTVALASNGFGHRLAHLSYSYMCNAFPHKRQLLINWFDPNFISTNRVWHSLFEDSPLLAGLPSYWSQDPVKTFEKVNKYRKSTHTRGKVNKQPGANYMADKDAGDYSMYYQMDGPSSVCNNWGSVRDLWLLRTAKEPSVQEFYQLLRAQLRQSTKDKIASFIETFPKDKIVVGVHIRAGNGKDDGMAHFDSTNRGDWLKDLPAAIRVVRKHLRIVAFSMMNRYNTGSSQGLDFDKDEFDEEIDGAFRIFLATDSPTVLDEFRRQHPNVLSLQQDRLPNGEGVAILKGMQCSDNKSNFECQVQAQEAMLMDAYILSSCDAVVAESFSNFMYTIPASIMMAEGRAFCESGRAALGGKYVLGDHPGVVFGGPSWWIHPPSDIMPVRCHQGGWAARDRSDFSKIKDV